MNLVREAKENTKKGLSRKEISALDAVLMDNSIMQSEIQNLKQRN